MSEVQRGSLKERLVAGLERNGKRRRFDARAKDEWIRACREPGAAIARIAREHGLNPNLLRQWINRDRQSLSGGGAMAATDGATPAFIPVVTSPCKPARRTPKDGKAVDAESAPAASLALMAELPNGIKLKLECHGADAARVAMLIEALGRYHVPAGR